MYVLGLTGSIGMGKSTVAAMLRRLGVPVHDADAAVHKLMARGGGAVEEVERSFPGVTRSGAIDRAKLGRKVFADPESLRRLEAILHPMVRRSAAAFLRRQCRARATLVVLDIPLLYETGGEALCDGVLVVSAPRRLQRLRVLRRPGMTAKQLAAIEAKQMPDPEKRRRADFVISTALSKNHSLRQLKRLVTLLDGRKTRRRVGAWPPRGYRVRGRARHRRLRTQTLKIFGAMHA